MSCILENSPTANNTEVVCENCMIKYLELDKYYKSLSSDSIGVDSICMDIVDSVSYVKVLQLIDWWMPM